MEGRWAVLAVRACRTGALDFTHITTADPASIVLERLVLSDIERELYAEVHMDFAKVLTDAKSRQGLFRTALEWRLPWEKEPGKLRTQQMVELWEKFEEVKKSGGRSS